MFSSGYKLFLGKNFWPFFLVLCVLFLYSMTILCCVDWHFAFIYLELDEASHVGKGNLGHCHKSAIKVSTK